MPVTATERTGSRRPELSLYSASGERKYINADERQRFLKSASTFDLPTQVYCDTLAYTGCRPSEALTLSLPFIQRSANVLAITSLKKRGRVVIREIPVPEFLIEELVTFAELTGADKNGVPLWKWRRTWAWTQVKMVMAQAGISGLQASPKGLRHGFGVHAVHCGVPLNLVQKWLGHAQLSTTAIYANAVGPEEYAIAEWMW